MNTVWRSVMEAQKGLFQTKFLFGSVTSVIAIPFIGHNYFNLSKGCSVWLGLSCLGVYFLVLFFFRLWENYKIWFANHFFDSIWGDGLLLIQQVREVVRNYEDGATERDDCLQQICNEVKKYFDKLTKKKCAVSIKLPIKPADLMELEVVNVQRDEESSKVRNTDVYSQQRHFVFQNTAYMTIITRLSKGKTNATYINNCVDVESNYETTSLAAYPGGVLPYKSEMVTAIRKYPLNKQMDSPSELMGFFCVDCSDKDAFSKDRYYICLADLISDALFTIVKPVYPDTK